MIVIGMVFTGQEIQGTMNYFKAWVKSGNVFFELGKNYIFERSQEKVIFQVNVKLFIFVVIFTTKDGDTFLFVVYYLHCPEWLTESQPAFPFPRWYKLKLVSE